MFNSKVITLPGREAPIQIWPNKNNGRITRGGAGGGDHVFNSNSCNNCEYQENWDGQQFRIHSTSGQIQVWGPLGFHIRINRGHNTQSWLVTMRQLPGGIWGDCGNFNANFADTTLERYYRNPNYGRGQSQNRESRVPSSQDMFNRYNPVTGRRSLLLLQEETNVKVDENETNAFYFKSRQEIDAEVQDIILSNKAKEVCQQAGVVQFLVTCADDVAIMAANCVNGVVCDTTGIALPDTACGNKADAVCRQAKSDIDDAILVQCRKVVCEEAEHQQYWEEYNATLEDLNEEADTITIEAKASACQNKTVGVITKVQVEAKPRSAEEIAAFPSDVQLNAGCKDAKWFYKVGTDDEAIVQSELIGSSDDRVCQSGRKLCTNKANQRLQVCAPAPPPTVAACERKKVYAEHQAANFSEAEKVYTDAKGRKKYQSCPLGMQMAMPRSKSEILAAIDGAKEAGDHIWLGATWNGGEWKWIDGGIANVDNSKVPGSASKGLCIKTTVQNDATTVKDDFLHACDKADLHMVLCETRIHGAGFPKLS